MWRIAIKMRGVAEGTLISLLSGEETQIENLTTVFFKTPIYSYSLSEDGISVGKLVVKYQGYDKTLEVTIDNGDNIRCGFDQGFIMRDGSIKKANELRKNDSLMPLYRKISDKSFNIRGYELIHNPISNKWLFTHRIVGSWKYPSSYPKHGVIIHHKDCKSLNNDPDNLILMNNADHLVLHQEFLKCLLKDIDFKEFMREVSRRSMNKNRQNPEFMKKLADSRSTPDIRKIRSMTMKENWKREEFKNKKSEEMSNTWNDPEWREKMSIILSESSKRPEIVENMKKLSQERWNDPAYRKYHSEIARETCLRKWQDPEYRSKMIEARRKRADQERQSKLVNKIQNNVIYENHKVSTICPSEVCELYSLRNICSCKGVFIYGDSND